MVSNSGTMPMASSVGATAVVRRAQQTDLAEQHRHLEHVGHRLALGDDVVLDRIGPERAQDAAACRRIASSLVGELADDRVDTQQWTGCRQFRTTAPRPAAPRRAPM